MAKRIDREKFTTSDGDIIERNTWKVEKSKDFPDGIKYRLVYIHHNKRVLGYDNERAKGHHKHWLGREEKYEFTDQKKLYADFEEDVKKLRRILYGNQKS